MICKKCKAKCEENDIYCPACGHPTGIVKGQLSAIKFFFSEYSQNRQNFSRHIGYSFLVLLLGILPVSITIWFSYNTNFIESSLLRYFISNLAFLIFIPLILIPFSNKKQFAQDSNKPADFFSDLKSYGKYFVLTLIGILYLMFFKFICQGDAILNLVRLVMVIYGVAIILPVPYLLEDKEMKLIPAVKKAYHFAKHTVRWQYFFLSSLLFLLNISGLIVAFIVFRFKFFSDAMTIITHLISIGISAFWLMYTLPFTWNTILNYTRFLDKQRILDYQNNLV